MGNLKIRSYSGMHHSNSRQDVHDHPAHKHELSLDDEDKSLVSAAIRSHRQNTHLQTIHRGNHGQRNDGDGGFARRNDNDEVDELDVRYWADG